MMAAKKHVKVEGSEAVVDATASISPEETATDNVTQNMNVETTTAVGERELDELGQARAEADELRDKLMRLQAEWDNYRKRTANERAAERSRSTEHLVEKLLPVIDDMERAIEHSDSSSEDALREGIVAIQAKLNEVLEREGCRAIDPQGQPFDAMKHQAVGNVENPAIPNETVTEVYQKGYEMGNRVLRTAMVVVSIGGPERSDTEQSA